MPRCSGCDCNSFFMISTDGTNLLCPECHNHHVRQHYHETFAFTSSDPNPIFTYGPSFPNYAPTPLHTSDYVDSDDEDLFNTIIDRIANDYQVQQRNQRSATSESFINSLPILTFTGSLSKSCSICKEDFSTDEKMNQLPCEHTFHHECIIPWLNQSNTCPLCRFKLPEEHKSQPLKRVLVTSGNLSMEMRTLVSQHGPLVQASGQSISFYWRPGQSGTSLAGLAGTALVNGDVNVMLDEDGDTVMLDA